MAPENFILETWNEQQLVFSNNLRIIRQKPTKKSVHDLRVSIKKIRSYLRLRVEITGELWKEQFAPVKNLFTTSGILRDFEMSLPLLLKYHQKENLSLPSFTKYLQLNKSLTQKWTKKATLEFYEDQLQLLTNSMYSSSAALTNEELIIKIKELAEGVLKKITLLVNDLNKNAHEIRKLLKDLYYWLIVCPNNPVSDLVEIKFLDKILHYLGEWQDNFIFHKKLKYFRNEYLLKKSKEAETAKIIEKKTYEIRSELLSKVTKALHSIINEK